LQPENGFFFISYRLAFSIPANILELLSNYKTSMLHTLSAKQENKLRKNGFTYNFDLFKKTDSYLDDSLNSPNWLENQRIADIIIDSLIYNNDKLYKLHYCIIMPNHVHLVVQPLKNGYEYFSLAKIMKEHKSFTARQSNKLLQRSGQFWHHENYDHYIRNDEEYYRIKDYVLNNPVKAGLIDHYKNWEKKLILIENP